MPVYEYHCDDCGKKFEITQSMHDAPVDVCPECKGSIRRIISGGSGFIMKNSGPGITMQPRCGKTQTCCGSQTPCDTPSCEYGE